MKYIDKLRNTEACEPALTFCAAHSTLQRAWDACPDPRWMLWLLGRTRTTMRDGKKYAELAARFAKRAAVAWAAARAAAEAAWAARPARAAARAAETAETAETALKEMADEVRAAFPRAPRLK